jgi:hypothetical protein
MTYGLVTEALDAWEWLGETIVTELVWMLAVDHLEPRWFKELRHDAPDIPWNHANWRPLRNE